MKKYLSIILTMMLVISIAPISNFTANAATSGECGTNLTWEYNTSTKELVISGTGSMNYYGSGDAPWESFEDNIVSIVINEGATSISAHAFSFLDSLKNISIPDSVTSISSYSLSHCEKLENIIVDINNKNYSNDEYGVLFDKDKTTLMQYPLGNSRESYIVPNTVTLISKDSFSHCDSLKSIIISDEVTTIQDFAFSNCYNLANISIGKNLSSIGHFAFAYCDVVNLTVCEENEYYCHDEFGVLYNKDKTTLVKYVTGSSKKSYIVPQGVTEIESCAFGASENLLSVELPDGIKVIDDYSFTSCDKLENINIPETVTIIGDSAFLNCYNLREIIIPESVITIGDDAFQFAGVPTITVNKNNPNYSSDEYGVLFNKNKTKLIQYPNGNVKQDYKIHDSVTTIEENAFSGSDNLLSVIIPKTISKIDKFTFSNCHKLKSITIPDTVKSIEHWAFKYCNSLKDVFYYGTEEQWSEIFVDEGNENLLNARIHFNNCSGFAEEITLPTCTNLGYTTYICECGYSYKNNYVVASGHDILIDNAVKATCTETGLTAGQHCSRCDGVTVVQDVIPALGHVESDPVIENKNNATCKQSGSYDTVVYCSVCDDEISRETVTVDAYGHDIIIDNAVEATCTTTGLTEGQHCSRCIDATIEQEIIPPKSHNHIAKYDSTKHWKECSCGSKIDEQSHSFVSGNICSCGYKRVVNATLSIKNNTGSKTINYGETLKLTSIVNNKPYEAEIYWYVDGVLMGEGEIYNVSFDSGTKIVTAKLVDVNGIILENASGNEISDSEEVTVKSGFIQKIISFFKNLFGANRTVVQTIFKGVF